MCDFYKLIAKVSQEKKIIYGTLDVNERGLKTYPTFIFIIRTVKFFQIFPLRSEQNLQSSLC